MYTMKSKSIFLMSCQFHLLLLINYGSNNIDSFSSFTFHFTKLFLLWSTKVVSPLLMTQMNVLKKMHFHLI